MALTVEGAARSLPGNMSPLYLVVADEAGHVPQDGFQAIRAIIRAAGGGADLPAGDPAAAQAVAKLGRAITSAEQAEAAAIIYNEAGTNAQQLGILEFLGLVEFNPEVAQAQMFAEPIPGIVVADMWPTWERPESDPRTGSGQVPGEETHQGIGMISYYADVMGWEVGEQPAVFVNGNTVKGKLFIAALGHVGLDKGNLPEGHLGGILVS